MNRTAVVVPLLLALAAPVQAEYVRPVGNMSVREIEDERSGIREHRQYVNYMRRTAEGIRDGKCSSYWKGAIRTKREHDEVPTYYSEKRAAILKQNQNYLAQYEQCFSRELRGYPKIYNNDLDPARSYAEFKAVHDKLTGQLNKQAARFNDLTQELKRRGETPR